jgi:predicted transcriptional regulator
MDGDFTPEIAQLLAAAAGSLRGRGVMRAVIGLLARTDPAELAGGISQIELGQRAGVTDRSVRRALRQLEHLGVVTQVRLPRHKLGYVVDYDRLAVLERHLP